LEARLDRHGSVLLLSPWVVSASLLLALFAGHALLTSLALILVFSFSYGCLLHVVLTNFKASHYVADLAGGLAGLLFAFLTLETFGAEAQLFLLAIVFTGVVVTLIRRHKFYRLASVLLCFSLVFVGLYLRTKGQLDLLLIKSFSSDSPAVEFPLATDALAENRARVLASRWSTVARVDALYYPESGRSLLHYNNRPFSMLKPRSDKQITILSELIEGAKSALVIGVGGGGDLEGLLQLGVNQITGVEVNSATIGLMKNELLGPSDQLYSQADIVLAEGRAYVERNRNKKKFDVIVLKGTDLYVPQWQSHIFLESYLYTKEALSAYWDLLSENGALIIIRAFFPSINRSIESVRLMQTHKEFLQEKGLPTWEHLFVFSHGFGGNQRIPKRSVFFLSKKKRAEPQTSKIRALPKYFSTRETPADAASAWPSEVCLSDLLLDRSRSCDGVQVASTTDNYPFFSALSRKDVLRWSVLDSSSLLFTAFALLAVLIYSLSSVRLEIPLDGFLKFKSVCLSLGLVSGFLYPFYYHNLLLFSPSPNHLFLIVQFGTVAGSVLGVWLANVASLRLVSFLMLIPLGLILLIEIGRTNLFRFFGESSFNLLLAHLFMIFSISAVTGSIFPKCLVGQGASLSENMRLRLFGLNLTGLGVGVISSHFVCILFGLKASFFVVVALLGVVMLIILKQERSREIKPT